MIEFTKKERVFYELNSDLKKADCFEFARYHVGLRYSGNSRIAVSVALKLGFLPLTIPFGIRGLDLDGEMWVKLRLIPTEPWVGTATWAFLSLPKVTLAVAPFGILNLMGMSSQHTLFG
jgi:Ca2+-dependent lipid-binding protein